MITALVVDDEPRAIERLSALLEACPTVDVIGTARDVADAERFLTGRTVDVVFLDLEMPGRHGLELTVPAATRIVVVSAHADRALAAFEKGAIDYLLKPVDPDRLTVAIDRLGRWQPSDAATDSPAVSAVAAGLASTTATAAVEPPDVDVDRVLWVEALRNYPRVLVRHAGSTVVRRTLTEWEAILPAASFARVGRSLIVQVAAIRSLAWQSRDLTLVHFAGARDPLPLGRAATARLKASLRT